MNITIGEKIKTLRKKHGLTQEKLADYLRVSYQAVSKWETGVASPDLSLIAPLTKLLHVSADELLGLNDIIDSRRVELKEAYDKTWNTGDLDERYKIAETAVSEYPGDTEYLEWLASAEYCLAFSYADNDEYHAWLEKSVKHYEIVIEDTNDFKVKKSALSGIVMTLRCLNRKDEALKYAELYPADENGLTKSEVMDWCLTGEELRKNRQQRLSDRLERFLGTLIDLKDSASSKAIADIVKVVIPDGNYLYFNDFLFIGYIYQAQSEVGTGNHDEAIVSLRKAYDHAVEFDKMVDNSGIHKYTTPLLDLVDINTDSFCRTGIETKAQDFKTWLGNRCFDPIREREEFIELEKKEL
jgi:Predicted transcriptional regulators